MEANELWGRRLRDALRRHRFGRLRLLGLEGALRVGVRHAGIARDRDERRRRRDHDGLLLRPIVRHRHRLLRGGNLGLDRGESGSLRGIPLRALHRPFSVSNIDADRNN